MSKLIHYELSNKVLSCAFEVHKILGLGLLESCYEEALVVEFKRAGIPFQRQAVYSLCYKGQYIGGYIADLVVDDKIVLELKSVSALCDANVSQLLNYLRLSKCRVGYLMNFNASRLQFKRYVL